jgi:uncharacterized protein
MANIHPHRRLLLLLLTTATIIGCQAKTQPAPQAIPTVKMTIGNKPFTLEIAADDATREHGLMNRASMPADAGMIFVFDQEGVQNFWMENTQIPLDIVFLDAGGRVVTIRTMKPFDLNTTSSVAPAKYAVEINAGAAADCGVKSGDVLSVPAPVDAALKK